MSTDRREKDGMTKAKRSSVRERRCFADGLEDEGTNHESRIATLDSGKGQKMKSPVGSPEEAQSCQCLKF